MKESRFLQLNAWLCNHFNIDSLSLSPLTGDAGFRKYYRFKLAGKSYIAVDAIPEMSNNFAFLAIQKMLHNVGINVPEVIISDLTQGFLCLSDFGDVLFSDELTLSNMDSYYKQAIELLPKIANITLPKNHTLPIYNADFIKVELSIFSEWLLDVHLELTLNDTEKKLLLNCFDVLVQSAIEQPQVVVHRDYHSRNIMLLNHCDITSTKEQNQLGIIDFQDAVIGPITYDIVSLLRDCYVKWPAENVNSLLEFYQQLMNKNNQYVNIEKAQWSRWFDLMGIQRHIKASGIFARLFHRDHKEGYLKDIPLTLSYIVDITANYPELTALHDIVLNKVVPALERKTETKMKSTLKMNGDDS